MASAKGDCGAQRQTVDVLTQFPGSDIIIRVEGVNIFASSSVLTLVSPVLEKIVTYVKQLNSQDSGSSKTDSVKKSLKSVDIEKVLDSGTVTSDDFIILMQILHVTGVSSHHLQNRKMITRMLPILKFFKIKSQLQYCEHQLLLLPRHPQDFILSSENKFGKLREAAMNWASSQKYSDLISHKDWGVVGEKHRYEIFQNMLQDSEKREAKLMQNNRILEEKRNYYKEFVVDVEDIINGRQHMGLENTLCRGMHGDDEFGPHQKGSQRDCEKCRWYMISMIHNLFDVFRHRRASESMGTDG